MVPGASRAEQKVGSQVEKAIVNTYCTVSGWAQKCRWAQPFEKRQPVTQEARKTESGGGVTEQSCCLQLGPVVSSFLRRSNAYVSVTLRRKESKDKGTDGPVHRGFPSSRISLASPLLLPSDGSNSSVISVPPNAVYDYIK